MSYYIYKIAYKISDEIKAKKDAEKPFWWEHLHPEAKEKSIEEIDKLLLEGSVSSEVLKEMTKHEKYLAVSEGCYVIDCKKNEQELAQMESLKKELERSRTNILNQPLGSVPKQDFELKPIEFGKTGDLSHIVSSVSAPPSPMDVKIAGDGLGLADESHFSEPKKSDSLDLDDEHINIMASNIKDDDLFGSSDSGMAKKSVSSDVRKYAQSIVQQTVNQINNKADEIPDSVAVMKEQELLQAVIDELNGLK